MGIQDNPPGYLGDDIDSSITSTIDASAHDPESLSSAIIAALKARASISTARIPFTIVNISDLFSILHSEPLLSTRVSHYDYQGTSGTLRVSCMPPTPVHDVVGDWASGLLISLAANAVLTKQEAEVIHASMARTKLPQGIYKKQDKDTLFDPETGNELTKRSKREADIKTPDMCYRVRGKRFPTVVFEVGCTESQDDLPHSGSSKATGESR